MQDPDIVVCADPSKYFLYDSLHPSTRFQQWMGLKFFAPRMQALQLLPAGMTF